MEEEDCWSDGDDTTSYQTEHSVPPADDREDYIRFLTGDVSFSVASKLKDISRVYYAARTVVLSPFLTAYINHSTTLRETLSKDGLSVDRLNALSYHDQMFAISVHDDDGVLANAVIALKEGNAHDKYPDSLRSIESGTSSTGEEVGDRIVVSEGVRRMAAVTRMYDTAVLKMVSLAYDNRLDLIHRRMCLLKRLLEDLIKDDEALRSHAVELVIQFLRARDDTLAFLSQLPEQVFPRRGNFGHQRAFLRSINDETMRVMRELSDACRTAALKWREKTEREKRARDAGDIHSAATPTRHTDASGCIAGANGRLSLSPSPRYSNWGVLGLASIPPAAPWETLTLQPSSPLLGEYDREPAYPSEMMICHSANPSSTWDSFPENVRASLEEIKGSLFKELDGNDVSLDADRAVHGFLDGDNEATSASLSST